MTSKQKKISNIIKDGKENKLVKSRLKLPNGFGSIIKRTDARRRKPYEVRKWNADLQTQKVIGWFATYEEAIAFLVEYNKDPSIYSVNKITFSEVYELMAAERYPKIAQGTADNYKVAYRYCTEIYKKQMRNIKVADLQRIINNLSKAGIGYASQKKLKQLLSLVWVYAAKYDLISNKTDITRYLEIDKHVKVYLKEPFNTRQLGRVQKLITTNHEYADIARCIIMMCYCGCRPSEFLAIKRADTKLKQRVFTVRESKTEAGRNRQVPIHKKVLPLYEYFMAKTPVNGVGNLIIDNAGKAISYNKFRVAFANVMKLTKCKHTPHECRHTCATWLDNAGANDVATKKILGHACQGVTKGVYTHKTLHELKKAIDLIP